MGITRFSEYVLTAVQHTCCDDCNKLKTKFADVYNASGISRGEDSRHWRVQLLAPSSEITHGRHMGNEEDESEVPGLKLEGDGELVFDVQDPTLIGELMGRLKWMLVNHNSNEQIRFQLTTLIQRWRQGSFAETVTTASLLGA
ncbi:MAG: hypothetical protein ACREDR_01590 [Blastocatellia bacterium]